MGKKIGDAIIIDYSSIKSYCMYVAAYAYTEEIASPPYEICPAGCSRSWRRRGQVATGDSLGFGAPDDPNEEGRNGTPA